MDVDMESVQMISTDRDSVLRIIKQKDDIEKEIETYMQVLASHHIGLTEPLVDGEGYPRNDIDVYQIRHARHRIICLQNDHKAVMREIEKGLHALHSVATTSDDGEVEHPKPSGDPIAVVTKVTPGSPASLAGLDVHDKIIEFGSVNASNFQSLRNISFVAESSINRSIPVVVLRNKHIIRLSLTPKSWAGPGLLGCNIVLPENVDR